MGCKCSDDIRRVAIMNGETVVCLECGEVVDYDE